MEPIKKEIIKYLLNSGEIVGQPKEIILKAIYDEKHKLYELNYEELERKFQQLIKLNYIHVSHNGYGDRDVECYDFKEGAIKKLLDDGDVNYEEVFLYFKKLGKAIESSKQMTIINLDRIKGIEKTINKYEKMVKNVDKKLLNATKSIKIELLTLMGLFISIFSLIIINTTFMKIVEEVGSFWNKISFILVINFTVLLSIYGVMTIIRNITNEKNESKSIKIILVILFILIIVSLLMA